MNADVQKNHARAKAWLFDAAFPLWSTNGVDPRGGFREKLALDGSAIEDEKTRVRVQARQTFCYAAAAEMGWPQGAEFARMGADYILSKGFHGNGLPGMTLKPGEGLIDDRIDLYDVAFVLFALSSAARALDDDGLRQQVRRLLGTIDELLKRPDAEGGYLEVLPKPSLREQNPHMHLLEGMLAAYEVTGDELALKAARHLEAFAIKVFIDQKDGALHELANPDGSRPDDDRYEAGHQFEWTWLLHEKARLCAEAPHPCVAGLISKGRALTRPDGRVALSHHFDGTVREEIIRSWIITEAIKAYIVMAESGDGKAFDEITRSCDVLFEDHLLDNGGWMDKVDLDLNPASTDMPASTFYHVVLAMKELGRFSDGLK